MSIYLDLKAVWKKLKIKGQVKNYSSIELWIVETDTQGKPVARILPSGHKTPKEIDVDGFKRMDAKPIQGHNNWWKFYDFSTVSITSSDNGKLKISVITKTAVKENHFGKVSYIYERWGEPLVVIADVRRDLSNRIISYYVSGYGWLDFSTTFRMTCYHEIDNARPVFPKNGKPYIRSKRDEYLFNNFDMKGKV